MVSDITPHNARFLMDTTSLTLLERLRQPADADAWNKFVDLYTPLLFHWARRIGLGDHDAVDLVQDVFALLVKELPEFRYDRHKSFRAWLRTVTVNRWRENKRHRFPELSADLQNYASPVDADDFWDREYCHQLVGRALELMQTDFKPTTWKACWEATALGRPAEAVAAELGISVGAVYAAKFRVLARLRQELAGLFD
jgi:RNA polymerase sigma-70 factor (ECF subfamily)